MIEGLIAKILREKNDAHKPGDKFRVSEAGRCRLMRFWKRKGKPYSDPFTDRVLRIFAVGHIFHSWIEDLIEKSGWDVKIEMKLEDEHRRGVLDLLVRTDEGYVLYDFKTVHSRKFDYLDKEKDMHYIHQLITYKIMLKEQEGIDVNDLRLFYISKDDLRVREVPVFHDQYIKETMMDWKILTDYWNKDIEPKPNAEPWECRYCVYRSICPFNKTKENVKNVKRS